MILSELGGYLRKLRGKLSLREAAKRSGLSHSYIDSLEKGVHPRTGALINPSPEILKGLSTAYNQSYKDLMVRAGYSYDEKESTSIEETTLDIKTKTLLKNVDELKKDPSNIDFLIEMSNKMLGR